MDAQGLCRRAAALHQSGDAAGAERLTREALAGEPDNFAALHLLGVLCAQAGRKDEAEALLRAALKINRDSAPAFLNYGILLEELGRQEEALAAFDRAQSLKPDFTPALYNLANAQKALGRFDQALANYAKVLALQPGHAGALNNRAGALRDLGRFAEALESYDRALAVLPGDAAIWRNRANLLRQQKRGQEAVASYDRALAAEPDSAEAWDNRGAALWELSRIDEALTTFDRAIAADPAHAAAYFHKALCLLLLGRFGEGWPLLEWRRKLPGAATRNYTQAEWTGRQELAGKTLFVWWEEGLGDTIMFLRFAALAQAKGARVILSVPDSLLRLFHGAGLEIIGATATPPHFDYHIPLLSLPLALRTVFDSIPAPIAYLRAEPALAKAWGKRIGGHGFRIGIVWATTTSRSLGRSFALRQLETLAKIPKVRLIALQKHDGLEELKDLPPAMRVEVFPLDETGDAFVDSAAIMENLDLVISADTAAAHLAGALGRPVWVALQFASDWRWFLDRSDSPWYPSMRLFRQKTDGDWAGVFAAIGAALARGRNNAISGK
jgi:tetratricopeptide (TPR) repeat protein